MPIQFMSICDGGKRARDSQYEYTSMMASRRWETDAASYRLFDVLRAVAHLQFAQVILELAEHIIAAQVLVVDLRSGASMRDEVVK